MPKNWINSRKEPGAARIISRFPAAFGSGEKPLSTIKCASTPLSSRKHRATDRSIVSVLADEKRVCLSIQAKASLPDTRIIQDQRRDVSLKYFIMSVLQGEPEVLQSRCKLLVVVNLVLIPE